MCIYIYIWWLNLHKPSNIWMNMGYIIYTGFVGWEHTLWLISIPEDHCYRIQTKTWVSWWNMCVYEYTLPIPPRKLTCPLKGTNSKGKQSSNRQFWWAMLVIFGEYIHEFIPSFGDACGDELNEYLRWPLLIVFHRKWHVIEQALGGWAVTGETTMIKDTQPCPMVQMQQIWKWSAFVALKCRCVDALDLQ